MLAAKRPTHEYRDFVQTPRRIWYPTTVVTKHASAASQPGQADKDRVTKFYLNFSAEMKDELFQP